MSEFTEIDELLFDFHGRIERHGWMVMQVMGGGDRRGAPWAYTIGLADRYGHPELTVVGLDHDSSEFHLQEAATRVARGEDLAAAPVVEFDRVRMKVRPVHWQHWTTDRFAMWVNYYGALGRHPDPRAVQLVWPDDRGRYPGQKGFDPMFRGLQPRLDRAPRARRAA